MADVGDVAKGPGGDLMDVGCRGGRIWDVGSVLLRDVLRKGRMLFSLAVTAIDGEPGGVKSSTGGGVMSSAAGRPGGVVDPSSSFIP